MEGSQAAKEFFVAQPVWTNDLFSIALIIVAGLIGAQIAKKLKIPDIVVFLIVGILLGPSFSSLIAGTPISGILNIKQDSYINQFILVIGACYLLFDGGASIKFAVIKRVWITIVVISTIGVLITGAITASVAMLLGVPVLVAILLGAITASTDPATLVPIFKQVPIRDRVSQTVMSESAFNDAMGAIATFTVVGVISFGLVHPGKEVNFDVGAALSSLGWNAGIGLLIGGAMGMLIILFMAHKKLGIFRSFEPFVLLIGIIFSYYFAASVDASGYMAVFVCGIMVGNKESFGIIAHHEHQEKMEDAIGNTAFFMRKCIFILLGSQVSFAVLGQSWWQGLILLAVFLFIARPVTVFACALPDRRAKWTFKEMLFMSWTRETGVIPAALVGILAASTYGPNKEHLPGMEIITSITFIFILGTILIQAPTTAPLAKKLGLLKSQEK